MNRSLPRVAQWDELELHADTRWDTRGYYERAAGTIAAMHARAGPFAEARWDYLAEDLVRLRCAVERYCTGRVLDLGCGEGLWTPHYAGRTQALTLVDLSQRLLSRACVTATRFALPAKTMAIDVFREPERVPFADMDAILIAFLLSHYAQPEVVAFLRILRAKADASTRVLVVDSWYSPARRRKRARESTRMIADKGVRYAVRKRYVTKTEWAQTVRASGLTVAWQWWGKAFFVCRVALRGAEERTSRGG